MESSKPVGRWLFLEGKATSGVQTSLDTNWKTAITPQRLIRRDAIKMYGISTVHDVQDLNRACDQAIQLSLAAG
jgi:hypothetical protein